MAFVVFTRVFCCILISISCSGCFLWDHNSRSPNPKPPTDKHIIEGDEEDPWYIGVTAPTYKGWVAVWGTDIPYGLTDVLVANCSRISCPPIAADLSSQFVTSYSVDSERAFNIDKADSVRGTAGDLIRVYAGKQFQDALIPEFVFPPFGHGRAYSAVYESTRFFWVAVTGDLLFCPKTIDGTDQDCFCDSTVTACQANQLWKSITSEGLDLTGTSIVHIDGYSDSSEGQEEPDSIIYLRTSNQGIVELIDHPDSHSQLEFHRFSKETGHLPSNNIRAFIVSDGDVLIVIRDTEVPSNSGLFRYNRSRGAVFEKTDLSALIPNYSKSIIFSKTSANDLFLTLYSNGLIRQSLINRIDRAAEAVTLMTIYQSGKNYEIAQIAELQAEGQAATRLWLAINYLTDQRFLRLVEFNGSTFTNLVPDQSDSPQSIYRAMTSIGNRLFVGKEQGGLDAWKWDGTGFARETSFGTDNGLTDPDIQMLWADSGSVRVGTASELLNLRLENPLSLDHYSLCQGDTSADSFTNCQGIASSFISDVLCDKVGNLWAAGPAGISKRAANGIFDILRVGATGELDKGRPVVSLAISSSGSDIIVGTSDAGLFSRSINGETKTFIPAPGFSFPPTDDPGYSITKLLSISSTLLIGTANGLRLLNWETQELNPTILFEGELVTALSLWQNQVFVSTQLDNNAKLYLLTIDGSPTFQLLETLASQHVNAVRPTQDGNLWIGAKCPDATCFGIHRIAPSGEMTSFSIYNQQPADVLEMFELGEGMLIFARPLTESNDTMAELFWLDLKAPVGMCPTLSFIEGHRLFSNPSVTTTLYCNNTDITAGFFAFGTINGLTIWNSRVLDKAVQHTLFR